MFHILCVFGCLCFDIIVSLILHRTTLYNTIVEFFKKSVINYKDNLIRFADDGVFQLHEYDRDVRYGSYPRYDMSLRNVTDESFREQSDSSHHREKTPHVNLPIDLIKDFPVADSLHLLDLGIIKRFLLGWTKGTL